MIKQEIRHSAFNFHLPQKVTKNLSVITEVKKHFPNKLRSKSQNGFYQPPVFYAIRNPRTAPKIYKA